MRDGPDPPRRRDRPPERSDSPHRLDALATLLTRFGLPYTLELYAEDGTLLRELRR
ncbi:hypothetical protein [Streptomyces sp. NPDC048584]|uniref:hypothetical protein n=1 Tax=Streptomyces sp. NPDC048584 TaxID=3365573 RepID=UPI0037205518